MALLGGELRPPWPLDQVFFSLLLISLDQVFYSFVLISFVSIHFKSKPIPNCSSSSMLPSFFMISSFLPEQGRSSCYYIDLEHKPILLKVKLSPPSPWDGGLGGDSLSQKLG